MQDAMVGALNVLTDGETEALDALFIRGESFRVAGRRLRTSPRTLQRRKASAINKLRSILSEVPNQPDVVVTEKVPGFHRRSKSVPLATCRICGSQTTINSEHLCDTCSSVDGDRAYAAALGRFG